MRILGSSARSGLAALALLAIAAAGSAGAVQITYQVANVSADRWRYTYQLTNDDLAFAAGTTGFSVYFPLEQVSSLTEPSEPSGSGAWALLVLQPDAGLAADGLFDALPLIDLAPGGANFYSFEVSFDWLGGSTVPGPQAWEVYELDASGELTVLQSGVTVPLVPEPGASILLACGLLLLLAARGAVKARRACVWLVVAALLAHGEATAQSSGECPPQDPNGYLSATSLQPVSWRRLTQTRFRYTYRVTASNSEEASVPAEGATLVRATVTSLNAATSVTDGSLDFPTVMNGGSAQSLDTFSVVHDRRVPFDRSRLCFAFEYELDYVVPDLRGKTRDEAVEIVTTNGYLELGRISYANDPAVPLGSVAAQVPAAGTPLGEANTVDVFLSLGPESASGFRLDLPAPTASVGQGSGALVPVQVTRQPGFADPVEVTLIDPPPGISANQLALGPELPDGRLSLLAGRSLDLGGPIDLIVLARSGDQEVRRLLQATIIAPQPTAQEEIGAALAAGDIDLGTSLVYRMYAMLGDPRLPESYRGASSVGEDFTLFEDIAAHAAQLTDAQNALLRPYLARPADPESIWSEVEVAPVASSSSAVAVAELGGVRYLESPTCPVPTYGPTWIYQRSADPLIPVIVWARCKEGLAAGETQLADLAVQVGRETVDRVWRQLVGVMRIEALPDLGGSGTPFDPDPSIDVYVLGDIARTPRGQAAGLDVTPAGYTQRVQLGLPRQTSAYVAVLEGALANGDAHAQFRATLVHELFHVLQFAHNSTGLLASSGGDSVLRSHWFFDASAEWAAAHFDRTTGWSRHGAVLHGARFREFAGDPGTPLNEHSVHRYSAYIWPFFMELMLGEVAGPAAIGAIWQALANLPDGNFEAADGVISQALPFSDFFPDFALVNLNRPFIPGDDPLPEAARYVRLDRLFPDGAMPDFVGDPGVTPKMVTQYFHEVGESTTDEIALAPLSTLYYAWNVDNVGHDTWVGALRVDWSTLSPNAALNVDALVFTQNEGWTLQRLKGKGREVFCVPSPQTSATNPTLRVWLVVTNSSHAAGASISGAIAAETLASSTECGCERLFSGDYCLERLQYPDSAVPGDAFVGNAINLGGRIAGHFDPLWLNRGPRRPVLWRQPDDPIALLSSTDPRTGLATDLNDSDQIVGRTDASCGAPNCVALWDGPSQSPTVLPDVSGMVPRINNVGDIAFATAEELPNRLKLWREGVLFDLGVAENVYDINDYSHILFDQAFIGLGQSFLLRGARLTALPIYGRGLNNLGTVVGFDVIPGTLLMRPARWREHVGRELVLFPTPPPPPVSPEEVSSFELVESNGQVNSINNRGEMVGSVTWKWRRMGDDASEVQTWHAIYWGADGFPVDLNDELPFYSGACLNTALAINDRGWISAQGEWSASAESQARSPGLCQFRGDQGFRLIPQR